MDLSFPKTLTSSILRQRRTVTDFQQNNQLVNNTDGRNQPDLNDWEKWIQYTGQLYARHENRLWYLRDQVRDLNIGHGQTATALSEIGQFIQGDLNPWRQQIASIIIPLIYAFQETNLNPRDIATDLARLKEENYLLKSELNELKSIVATIQETHFMNSNSNPKRY